MTAIFDKSNVAKEIPPEWADYWKCAEVLDPESACPQLGATYVMSNATPMFTRRKVCKLF